MTDLKKMNAALANTCAQLLKMTLTAAQAHALQNGRADLVDGIGRLSECKLVVHARHNELHIEVLAPGLVGDTVLVFSLDAESGASLWIH